MNAFSTPRLSLIAGPNNPEANQDKLYLEPEAQRHFDSYHDSFSIGKPFPSALLALLTAWLERRRGCQVCFEIAPPLTWLGEVKRIEVANKEELDSFIGNGKTLSTFLQAFASVDPVLQR
jgi:hypothetical protein